MFLKRPEDTYDISRERLRDAERHEEWKRKMMSEPIGKEPNPKDFMSGGVINMELYTKAREEWEARQEAKTFRPSFIGWFGR